MGILKIIFIIFLGAFSLGETVRFDLGNNIAIKPVDISLIVLVLTWIIYNSKNLIKILRSDRLFLPIVCVIVIMVISLAISLKNFSGNEILVSLSYALRWTLYASLYFVVKSFSSKFKNKILYLLIAVGGLITLFGFVQYFLYSNLRNLYYLGWDEHMYRMFSTFLDPNFAGSFFVLYLIFLLGLVLYLFKNNKIKQAYLLCLISVFSLISVFLSYSRSALIMFFVSIIIFCILVKKWYLIFGFFLISLIFILISSRNFNIENINLFRIASSEARIDSAKIAINIIKNNPLFGVGFNTYRYTQVKYGFKNPINASVSHADAGTDNSFLFVLATTGIIGFIFYVALLRTILTNWYKDFRKYKDNDIQKYIVVVAVVSMAGLIVDSFFINSLFYSFTLIWVWILLGLTENK